MRTVPRGVGSTVIPESCQSLCWALHVSILAGAHLWEQWKNQPRRYRALRKLDVHHELAANLAGSGRGAWRLNLSPAFCYALPNALFAQLGLVQLAPEPNR